MADWGHLNMLNIDDELRDAADEFEQERDRGKEEVNCHCCHGHQSE